MRIWAWRLVQTAALSTFIMVLLSLTQLDNDIQVTKDQLQVTIKHLNKYINLHYVTCVFQQSGP